MKTKKELQDYTLRASSVIAEGSSFSGDLDINGLLRIDGDFFGNIRVNGKILIGKNGRAQCRIEASTVVIGGALKGDIICSGGVVLLSTGMVIGNIYAKKLIIEEGVILDGRCFISESNPVMEKGEAGPLLEDQYKIPWNEWTEKA